MASWSILVLLDIKLGVQLKEEIHDHAMIENKSQTDLTLLTFYERKTAS